MDTNEELFRKRLDGLEDIRALIIDVRSNSCSSAYEELSYALQRIKYATDATIREQNQRRKICEEQKRFQESERRQNGC